MKEDEKVKSTSAPSVIVPFYKTGDYYATHADPDQDASFKASAFLKLFRPIAEERGIHVRSYADVGCGGGGTAALIADGLRKSCTDFYDARGYDISPHIKTLNHRGVEFYEEDFCASTASVDMVTLFDVVEHVPDPVQFLRGVAARCNFIALHIPLDDSIANSFFDRFRRRLRYPGHLVVLDTSSALNLVALSGILSIGYAYTHGYSAPSGAHSVLQKLAFPFRALIAHISPWLASKTIGGVSLMVVGVTPKGLSEIRF